MILSLPLSHTVHKNVCDQALISALHWFSLLQLLLPQNMLEQVVAFPSVAFPSLCPSPIFSCSLVPRGGEEDSSSSSLCLSVPCVSKFGHVPSLHVHIGILTEGNGLHVTGQNISDETEDVRVLLLRCCCSVVGEDWSVASLVWSIHGAHNPSDIGNFVSLVRELGRRLKDTIPCLQRGQGIEPGGSTVTEGTLLDEQRYNAHLTHSWWSQPERQPTTFVYFKLMIRVGLGFLYELNQTEQKFGLTR